MNVNKIFFFSSFILSFVPILVSVIKAKNLSKHDRGWMFVFLGIGFLFVLSVLSIGFFLGLDILDIITLDEKLAPRAPIILGFGVGLIMASTIILLMSINADNRD